jgi:Mn-dependent DtxR family transcriptional regulator
LSNIDEESKNPFSENYLRMIDLMIKHNGNTEIVAAKMGKKPNDVDQMFFQLRRKYDKARNIVNIYENWRRNKCLRKRLF